jgi:hypothetical protein
MKVKYQTERFALRKSHRRNTRKWDLYTNKTHGTGEVPEPWGWGVEVRDEDAAKLAAASSANGGKAFCRAGVL